MKPLLLSSSIIQLLSSPKLISFLLIWLPKVVTTFLLQQALLESSIKLSKWVKLANFNYFDVFWEVADRTKSDWHIQLIYLQDKCSCSAVLGVDVPVLQCSYSLRLLPMFFSKLTLFVIDDCFPHDKSSIFQPKTSSSIITITSSQLLCDLKHIIPSSTKSSSSYKNLFSSILSL